MTRLFCILIGLLLSAPVVAAQCSSQDFVTYGSSYAVRSGGTLTTYSRAYTTGGDANYVTTGISQTDTLNGVQYGSTISASAGPNQTAQTTRTTNINAQGFGTYAVSSNASAYDACTGYSAPPFAHGSTYVRGNASITIQQPMINAPGPLYVVDYSNCQPGVTCHSYQNVSSMGASTGNTSGTPLWTLTGNTNYVTLSCTSCTNTRITATPAAQGSCAPSVQAYYTIDGLQSRTVNIQLLSVVAEPYGSPVHNAIAYGYSSVWTFQDQNSCGSPMNTLAMHETFPNGFSSKVQNNWPVPTPNSWTTGDSGLFTDTIGEAGSSLSPTAQNPQNPLNGTVVYDGFQYFYVNNSAISAQSQAHYIDHGGYE